MRTAADCFNDLRRHIVAGEPITEPELLEIAKEAHDLGCCISLAVLPADLGRLQIVNCWTTDFGTRPLAETALYRQGDAPTLIYPN